MNNFKFLTSINAVYNYYNFDADFNNYYNLLIYADEGQDILKIKYTILAYNSNEQPQNYIKKNEILLENTGTMETRCLLELFDKNAKVFKNIIFNKFLDYLGDELNFDIIY